MFITFDPMRILLLIPAMLLFLSNIPFIHKMEMKKEMVAAKKHGCCKKKERKPACHRSDDSNTKCNMNNESSCVCICGFSFAAPDQIANKLQFGVDILKQSLQGYYLQQWKDPLLSLPWQPPDVMV